MKDDRPMELARDVVEGLLRHTLLAEGGKGCDPALCSHPVDLEPRFELFDPTRAPVAGPQPAIPEVERGARSWSVFRLRLPRRPLPTDSLTAAIEASGASGARFSFEFLVDAESAELFLAADDPDAAAFLRDAWLSLCPGLNAIPWEDPWVEEPPAGRLVIWEAVPEPPYSRRMTIPDSPPLQLLLRQAGRLGPGRRIVYQVLYQAVRHDWHRNIQALNAAETLSRGRIPWRPATASTTKPAHRPLFAATLRTAVTGDGKGAGPNLALFWSGFTQGGRPFRVRGPERFDRALDESRRSSMVRDRLTYAPGALLSGDELAVFLQPPSPEFSPVRLDLTRSLQVPSRFLFPGRLLGYNYADSEPTPVRLPDTERNRSVYQIGSSRKGKSNSILHQCLEIARTDAGFALVDPHRATAFDLIRALPDASLDRVVWCDFDDPDFILDYNPFDARDAYGRRATEYVHSFKHLFDAASFHRMGRILGLTVHALFDLRANLSLVPALFSPTPEGERLRARVTARTRNPDVRRFFAHEARSLSSEAIAPVLNRLSTILLDEGARRVFERCENRVDIPAILREGRFLVVALPSNIDVANIVGGMLLAQIQKAALARIGRAEPDFYVFIDEFHRFLNSGRILESLLNECAKAGLFLCMAHQETGQLGSELFRAALTAPLIMVFGVNYEDARKFVPIFNGRVQVDDLLSLRVGEVYARLDHDIVDFRCPPPPTDLSEERARRVIDASRRLYYTSVATADGAGDEPKPRRLDHF